EEGTRALIMAVRRDRWGAVAIGTSETTVTGSHRFRLQPETPWANRTLSRHRRMAESGPKADIGRWASIQNTMCRKTERSAPRTLPKRGYEFAHSARMPASAATWRALSTLARTNLVNSSPVLGFASAP